MPAIRSALAPALALLAFAALAAADPTTGQAPSGPDPSASLPEDSAPGTPSPSAEPSAPGPRPASPRRAYPSRGRLGIEVQPMTAELREFFSAPSDRGVLVVHVEAGRAAQQAGIAVGDVLIAAGGGAIERPVDLIAAVARAPAGEKLAIELLQKGQRRTVEVVPEGEAIAEFAVPPHWQGGPGRPADRMARPPYEGLQGLDERVHELEQRLERLEHPPEPDER